VGSAGGVSLYTLWQLVIMHEHNGKRFSRYHELAQVCPPASGALAATPWSTALWHCPDMHLGSMPWQIITAGDMFTS